MTYVTLKLTPYQARVLWGVADGAADAGACSDGLEPKEAEALDAIVDKLLSSHAKWKHAFPSKGEAE
ncbi:hypothetical protein GN330_22955 [Nitratireductor sp. CAU 1489]|uniref:Uncharacterized protein n=1 Tax=Nitratireductor arenosus TaxID=2682096 RepID=A0A844QRA0_9HYPH|nr:hypothetical protein [Nitratireductor arenosus]MVB00110.1 hypothetical protein [Nitratireductor arenosus]